MTERNVFDRYISNITSNCVIGYKYYDFGEDFSSKTMEFAAKIRGTGCKSKIKIMIDDPENGEEIGICNIGMDDGVYTTVTKAVTGRHSVFLVVEDDFGGGLPICLKAGTYSSFKNLYL